MIANALPFTASLTFIPFVAMSVTYGGVWAIAACIYGFLVIPFLDAVSGLNTVNLDKNTEDDALFWHRLLTWIWVPIQIGSIFTVVAAAGPTSNLKNWEIIAAAVSLGIMTGGIGITYGHELLHQTNRFERALSEMLMTSTLYGHFCIEHVYGHHINVATPADPVTARYGESFYRFLPRALFGSLVSAWRIQAERLKRRGRPIWHYTNPFWRYGFATLVYGAVAYALAGLPGIGVFALQAFVAFLLLEIINYIEHYGLRRRLLDNGRYEHVQPYHSWNASHKFANYFLINLQRHSDHHKHPQRRFPLLQHLGEDEAPQLPASYPVMVILALFPSLWFRVMNPRVKAWRDRFCAEASA